jgi:hypothetical protein
MRAIQLIRGVFHLDIYWFTVIRVLFYVFWNLQVEWLEGAGDKGSGIPQQLIHRHSWTPF